MFKVGADTPSEGTAKDLFTSIPIVVLVSFVYLWGLIVLCRESLLLEAVVSLALPVLCIAGGWIRYHNPRMIQLLVIESTFNLLAVASKLSIAEGWSLLNELCSWGFLLFFAAQVTGFVVFQYKQRKPHGVVQSLTACILLAAWWLGIDDWTNTVDAAGRFLMWGEDAPLSIQIYYCVWIINVAFVDTLTLPWLRMSVAHLVSVGLSVASGEFFHARLLTACHLFVLNFVSGVAMEKPEGLGLNFGVIPATWFPIYERRVRPALAWLTSIGCVALVIASGLWGLDLSP